MIEPDCVELASFAFQLQFKVTFLEDALIDDSELIAKYRCRKALAPYLGVEQFDEFETEVGRFERTIGFKLLFQRRAGTKA